MSINDFQIYNFTEQVKHCSHKGEIGRIGEQTGT